MSSDSSSTAVQGGDGNPKSKTHDVSTKGKDVQKTTTEKDSINGLPTPNEDPLAQIDLLKGCLKDYPHLEIAVEMLERSEKRDLTGDEKTVIASKGKMGRLLFKSMPPMFQDGVLQEVDAMSKANQAYQHSEEGKPPMKLENGDIGANSGGYKWKVFNVLVTQDFSAVEATVSNFAQNSKILTDVLDEVAKIHPFIQGVVLLFKAGLAFEVARRENKEKVIALKLAMCDMMQVFTILQQVADPKALGPGGLTIEKRLKDRMNTTTRLIKHCMKVCDSYQKQRTVVKFFTSIKWKATFTDVAQEFIGLRDLIKRDLDLYIFVGITTVNATVTKMSADMGGLTENVGEVKEMVGDVKEMVGDVKEMVGDVKEMVSKFMKIVFERIQSPEEREVALLVAAQPGGLEAVLKNDALLGNVLAAHKSKVGKGVRARRHGAGSEEDKTKMVSELRKEMDKPVERVLEDNESFDKRLEVVRMQVDEVKVSIRRGTDRVIDVPVNGPTSERIIDPDIYQVWKEQNWGDSVEAKVLVLALYDHFAKGSPEDQWALKHIPLLRVQPLVEELRLDDDVSLPVTVSKLNEFTVARPDTWSLPEWISYWTHGFEMTVQWYLHRIRKVIAEIRRSGNIGLSSSLKQLVENVLPGLGDIKEWDDFNWEDDYVFYKFMNYVVENEDRIERALRGVDYCLEAASALIIVTGKGRLEKYILPLILLVMRRALWVVKQPGQNSLHELEVISGSLSTLADAVYDRVLELQEVYKPQNQDQLSKFFFGLYQIQATASKNTKPESPVPSSSGAQNTKPESPVPPSSGAQNTNPKDPALLSSGVQNINLEVPVPLSSGAQNTNPEDEQNANPDDAQNANPDDEQDTNPEDEQNAPPEEAQITNPEDEQDTNPNPVPSDDVAEDSGPPVDVEDSPPDDVEPPMDSESRLETQELEEANSAAEGSFEVEETGIESGEL